MERYTHKIILQSCDFSNFGNATSHISSSKYKRPHREIFPHSHTRLNFAQYDTHKKRKSFWRKKMWQKIKPKIFSHHPSGSWFITSSLFKKLQNKSWYFSLIVTPMNVWYKLMAKDVLNSRILAMLYILVSTGRCLKCAIYQNSFSTISHRFEICS